MKGTKRPKWAEMTIQRDIDGPILDIGCSYKSRKNEFDGHYFSLDIDKQTHPMIIGDAMNLPIKKNIIKNIICFAVLEHVKNPKKVLEESYKCLDKKGIIHISVPFLYFRHDWCDYYRFTAEGITELLKDFKIITIKKGFCGFFSTIISWLIPLTYEMPKPLRILSQQVIYLILIISSRIDIGKSRFYNGIYIKAKKNKKQM